MLIDDRERERRRTLVHAHYGRRESSRRRRDREDVAFYRFDAGGKLASERVVMNLGVLAAGS